MVDNNFTNKTIVITLIAIVFIISFLILRPIIVAIIAGALLAYVLYPLYIPLRRWIKRENLSTFIFIFLIFLLIAVPLWFLLPGLIRDIFDTYMLIQKTDFATTLGKLFALFLSAETAQLATAQANSFIANLFNSMISSLNSVFSNLPNILFQAAIMLFTFYFVIRDYVLLRETLIRLSPFSESTEKKFASEFRGITNAIVFGHLLVGVIKGLALGLGFLILGVDNILFLTGIGIILSIIPIIGPWLLWIPVALLLIVNGNVFGGVVLLFYGAVIISQIDNVLLPYIISRKSNLNVFVSLIGTIGGLYAFGVIGLIIGPLILSYLLIIIDFYKEGKLNELFKYETESKKS
jgi:predicted PurR-regulated permease PerM